MAGAPPNATSGDRDASQAGGPVAGWDIYEVAVSDDPHARWKRIREQHPVLRTGSPDAPVYFVTKWDLVNEVLRDARHGAGIGVAASFGATEGLAFETMQSWLMSLDGAPHTRARGLVRKAFTPRSVDRLRDFIAEACASAIADIERSDAAGIDLVEALALPLPSQVIRALFGFSADDWAREIEPIFRERTGLPMIESLAASFDARIREDRVPPGLLADLRIPDEEFGVLSDLEVVANAVLFVTAAIDTTAGLIGNAARCVLERPEVRARLRDDPSFAALVVEETLRFEPPALSCSRTAGVDFELGGVAIAAGSPLLLAIGAASRDPDRHPDPDRFDPTRFERERDASQTIAFGGGRHFCIGSALARLEARIAIEQLFCEADFELELEGEPIWQKRNPTIRAHERLCVRVRR